MSAIEDLYNKSKAPGVVDARAIPDQTVNFIDVNNEFSTEFKTEEKTLDPTHFTDKALNHFDTEIKQLTSPDGSLQRWTPSAPYGVPGAK
jgi:hypothetical protein